jgi:hypothetical protein
MVFSTLQTNESQINNYCPSFSLNEIYVAISYPLETVHMALLVGQKLIMVFFGFCVQYVLLYIFLQMREN